MVGVKLMRFTFRVKESIDVSFGLMQGLQITIPDFETCPGCPGKRLICPRF